MSTYNIRNDAQSLTYVTACQSLCNRSMHLVAKLFLDDPELFCRHWVRVHMRIHSWEQVYWYK